ncbi:hypothetical protein B0H14DRAFT_3170785 [Mycena olivaceomarginata]|nr:hypothetical protein B0H14DRAFT_3170785 [Mycena olivaceomarginata]
MRPPRDQHASRTRPPHPLLAVRLLSPILLHVTISLGHKENSGPTRRSGGHLVLSGKVTQPLGVDSVTTDDLSRDLEEGAMKLEPQYSGGTEQTASLHGDLGTVSCSQEGTMLLEPNRVKCVTADDSSSSTERPYSRDDLTSQTKTNGYLTTANGRASIHTFKGVNDYPWHFKLIAATSHPITASAW